MGTSVNSIMKISTQQIDRQIEEDSITESFLRYFSVDLATTPAQKESVYKIRYRVYCEEFGYEPADRFPNQIEYDAYDEYSLHCLITHISSGMPAGCVRLIPATNNGLCGTLPFEKASQSRLDSLWDRRLRIERNTVCELSRLAVDRAFRRRTGEMQSRFGRLDVPDFSDEEQRYFGLIAIAGFLALTALTDPCLTGRTNMFAMMEPYLPRLLKRSGIIFQKIGEDIDYHGVRAPYHIERTQSAMEKVHPDLKELYQAIYQQISQSYLGLKEPWLKYI